MVYKYGRQDIEEAALGKLVTIFERMNGNSTLIEKLRKLKSQRDELAHRALTNLYGRERETFKFDEHIDRLVDLANNLGLLIEDLNKEHVKLFALKPADPTSSSKNG